MSEINVNKLISTFGFKVDNKSFQDAEKKIKKLKKQLKDLQGTVSVRGDGERKRRNNRANKEEYDAHVRLLDRKLAAEARSERRRKKILDSLRGDGARTRTRGRVDEFGPSRGDADRLRSNEINRNLTYLRREASLLGEINSLEVAQNKHNQLQNKLQDDINKGKITEQQRQKLINKSLERTLALQQRLDSTSRSNTIINRGGGGIGAAGGAGIIAGVRGFSSGLMPSLAAGGAAFGSVAATRAIFRGTAELDAFESAMQNTLGTTEAAREELEWYIKTARDLKAPLVAGAKAYKTFLIGSVESGIGLEEARQVYKQTAAFGRIIGMSPDDMQGALRAYTQVASKGQLYAEELRQQLAERVPGIVSIVAHGLGVSTAELNKMMEAGEISGEMAYDALIKGFKNVITDEGMTAALTNLPSMWQGFLNSIEETIIELREMGSSDSMKIILGNMTTFIEGFRVVAVPTLMGFLKLLEGITDLLGHKAVGAVVAYLGVLFLFNKTMKAASGLLGLAGIGAEIFGSSARVGAGGVGALAGAVAGLQTALAGVVRMLRFAVKGMLLLGAFDIAEGFMTGKKSILDEAINAGREKLGMDTLPDEFYRNRIEERKPFNRSLQKSLKSVFNPYEFFFGDKSDENNSGAFGYMSKMFSGSGNLDQPTMDAMKGMGVQPSMQQSNMYNYEINIDAKGTNDPATIESTWRRVLDPLTKQLNSGSLSTPQN